MTEKHEKLTIIAAIKKVMNEAGRSLSAKEAYNRIIEKNLYTFHADSPYSVVSGEIRRHCRDIDFPSASLTKHFQLVGDDKFSPLPEPIRIKKKKGKPKAANSNMLTAVPSSASYLKEIRELHSKYEEAVRDKILYDLKKLSPTAFEHFARRLLEVYGFQNVKVTQITNDGGIDGSGRLKVGLAFLNVAFQCKRWAKGSVGRPEIDKFRGAIQGEFEQGIFFTTARFAPGAEGVSFKPGAVPIVLIDGAGIITLMVEKKFGVQIDALPIYTYALDLVLSEDENER